MAPRLRLIALGIFAVSLAVFSLARIRLVSLRAEGPAQARFLAGDEPSYLLLAHSAAFDLDFNLFNNRTAGDGRFFGMPRCEGHGARKDWGGREIYSIHTPGLPLLIAPAYALALRLGCAPRAVVLLFLNILAALLAVNLWLLCVALMQDHAVVSYSGWPPLFSTAAVIFTPPVIFYANLIYPELPAALLVLYAFRHALPSAANRRNPESPASPACPLAVLTSQLLSSLAVAFLPWLSFRFFLPALVLAALSAGRLWTTRPQRRAAALIFALPLLVSLALFFSYQHRAFGSLNPAAGYLYQNYGERGLSSRGLLDGVLGIFLDRGHGILTWSPFYILSLTGLLLLIRDRRSTGTWLVFLLLALYVPGARFVFWWGGFAPPPRYMVAPAPLLGAALCWALSRKPRPLFVAVFASLLAVGLVFGWLGCAHPGLLYRHRHPVTQYLTSFPIRLFPSFMHKGTSTWPLAALWGTLILVLNLWFFARWDRTACGNGPPSAGNVRTPTGAPQSMV